MTELDCVYIAASEHDARYTRICVASVRRCYPDVCIRVLPGGPLQHGLARELQRYWNVEVAPLPAGDYGWGFVKLEPLFGAPGERFLVLDSDTVLTGPVVDAWRNTAAAFLVDDEQQTEAETSRLYYDWNKVGGVDPAARPPQFVFNSGQWFGTSGVLIRDDFAPWLEWTMPRKLRFPHLFMPGEQGILNYVLNQKAALDGLQVERRVIMRWPRHGMRGLGVDAVSAMSAPALVVHWAGMKRTRQQDMAGADLLSYFEAQYYRRLPAGRVRRVLAVWQDVIAQCLRGTRVRVGLAFRHKLTMRARADAGP